MRKNKDIEDSIGEKSRHEEIQEFLKNIKLNKGKSRNEFMIEKKKSMLF